MFLTTSQKEAMNQPNADSERQNLLDRVLDAVKECQVRFGGKTELATDGDSRVTCLLSQFDSVMQHGFRKLRSNPFRQVGQVTGIVKQEPEQVYWSFVKEHLSKMEVERFFLLHNITTDTGRGRAWLRSSLNEHTLEKCFHAFLGDKTTLSNFYEPEAFLMDEERASMLPMMAAGLSSILFALNIDNEELNTSKLNVPSPSTREVLNNLLPAVPVLQVPSRTLPEPQPVYSAETLEPEIFKIEKKKKKKKKKVSAAIVSIEEDVNSPRNLTTELEEVEDIKVSSIPETISGNNPSLLESIQKVAKGHSRSSSYPGRIKTDFSVVVGTEKHASEDGRMFHDITKTISVPENLVERLSHKTDVKDDPKKDKTFSNSFKLQANITQGGTFLDSENSVDRSDLSSRSSSDKVDTNDENHDRTTMFCDNFQIMNNDHELNLTKSVKVITHVGLHCDDQTSSLSENLNIALEALERKNLHLLDEKNNPIFPLEHKSCLDEIVCSNPAKVSSAVSIDAKQNCCAEEAESKSLSTIDGQSFVGSQVTGCSRELDSPVTAPAVGGQLMTVITVNGQDNEMFFQLPSQEEEASLLTDQVNAMDSSKDDISVSSSLSWVEDGGVTEVSSDTTKELGDGSSGSIEAAVGATAVALAACSDAQRGMEREARFSLLARTPEDNTSNVDSDGHDGMSKVELKQAIVSMMLRKDEVEEQNRSLRLLLDKEMEQSSDLRAEVEQLNMDMTQKNNKDQIKIQTLSRENELLKHQLKKYVGAVQMLRRDLKGKQSSDTAEALLGIRQDEVLPPLPPKEKTEKEQSEETNEYKRKLIQVAEMHGELMEFNERLQRQLNYRAVQVRRLREELVNLRGPLPGNSDADDDFVSLSDIEGAISNVNTRPLINIWIPSVFLKGKSTTIYHIYQVYVRIKDDEWNVYRRYSQFYELHKKLRQKFKRKVTFSFPPKKAVGNRDSKFVEDRRKLLQEYLRKVINYLILNNPELLNNTNREMLLAILPFLGDPYPPEKIKKTKSKNKSSSSQQEHDQYQGL